MKHAHPRSPRKAVLFGSRGSWERKASHPTHPKLVFLSSAWALDWFCTLGSPYSAENTAFALSRSKECGSTQCTCRSAWQDVLAEHV